MSEIQIWLLILAPFMLLLFNLIFLRGIRKIVERIEIASNAAKERDIVIAADLAAEKITEALLRLPLKPVSIAAKKTRTVAKTVSSKQD